MPRRTPSTDPQAPPTAPLRGPFGEPLDVRRLVETMIEPDEPATIAFVCDDDRVPLRVVFVTGTTSHTAVHDVADVLEPALADHPELAGILLVSVRADDTADPEDLDRLLDLTARFDGIGVELYDWWIWGPATVIAMRAAAGLPSRW